MRPGLIVRTCAAERSPRSTTASRSLVESRTLLAEYDRRRVPARVPTVGRDPVVLGLVEEVDAAVVGRDRRGDELGVRVDAGVVGGRDGEVAAGATTTGSSAGRLDQGLDGARDLVARQDRSRPRIDLTPQRPRFCDSAVFETVELIERRRVGRDGDVAGGRQRRVADVGLNEPRRLGPSRSPCRAARRPRRARSAPRPEPRSQPMKLSASDAPTARSPFPSRAGTRSRRRRCVAFAATSAVASIERLVGRGLRP